jgi:tRNA-specific 2-thiouridylase
MVDTARSANVVGENPAKPTVSFFMIKEEKDKKIVVAMSGGVDSSVAAALLKRAGFCAEPGRSIDVIGIMMKFWKDGLDGKNRCCSTESEKLARAVAKKIGIPFYVINVEKEFKKKVVDYFLAEYKKGNTPNPCVVCNKEIKFGFLIKKALLLGADFIATGHYARLGREIPNPKSQIPNKSKTLNSKPVKLLKGADEAKDQSYFLWQLNQNQLKRIIFPVGNYTKPEVRKLAKKFKLPTAKTPESQEVCFISQTTNDFLKKYLKTKPGKIMDVSGKILGKHNGLWFYTIGQRRGLEIQQGSASAQKGSGETKPWFVVAKYFKKNILIVSKNKKDLEKKELIAGNVNWISPIKLSRQSRGSSTDAPSGPITAEVKIRYKSGLAKAKILVDKRNSVKIIFVKPQRAITSGQSAVFYKGAEVLGGGTIDKSY